MVYIGFWRRFAAVLIDGIVLWVVQIPINMIFGGGNGVSMNVGGAGASSQSPIASLLSLIIWVGYVVWFQSKYGQTLGKKAMGIKVVTLAGKQPSMMTFFLRDIVGKIISGIILCIGYLMVIWDPKKQALHDKIASTYVVKA